MLIAVCRRCGYPLIACKFGVKEIECYLIRVHEKVEDFTEAQIEPTIHKDFDLELKPHDSFVYRELSEILPRTVPVIGRCPGCGREIVVDRNNPPRIFDGVFDVPEEPRYDLGRILSIVKRELERRKRKR